MHNIRLCSIGINRIRLVGFFCVVLCLCCVFVVFGLVCLINLVNRLEMVERALPGVTAFQPKMVGKVLY